MDRGAPSCLGPRFNVELEKYGRTGSTSTGDKVDGAGMTEHAYKMPRGAPTSCPLL